MPEQETRPVNKYLPPRPKDQMEAAPVPDLGTVAQEPKGFLKWLDKALEKI